MDHTTIRNRDPHGRANCFQYAAPIVLGTISESNNMANVSKMEASVRAPSP